MSNKNTTKPIVSKSGRRQIARAVTRAKPASNRSDSAQKTIPYQQMYRDGLCHVHGNTYSKTIQFLDINYRLVQDSDKSEIFDGWCKFLNNFDSSIHFQLSFYNLKSELDEDLTVTITPRDDDYNDVRQEYSDMLQNQLLLFTRSDFSLNLSEYWKAAYEIVNISLSLILCMSKGCQLCSCAQEIKSFFSSDSTVPLSIDRK